MNPIPKCTAENLLPVLIQAILNPTMKNLIKNPAKLYIDLLYDRASKCINEEIVAQAGKPLLETFVRYIEHVIESTDAPKGLNKYLDELTDDKYSIEERGKEVIACFKLACLFPMTFTKLSKNAIKNILPNN